MFSNKQAESFPTRSFYKGKGVDWPRFLPWLLATLIVAALLAEGMAQLFRVGQYYIFIVPAVAALGVVGMITLAVKKGHCRSVLVAGLSGFCAGLILYMGHIYLGMIHDFGPEVATHPEFFPTYLRLRMALERTHDVGQSPSQKDEQAPTTGNTSANWGRFVFELGMVLVITTGGGIRRARKAYCENCRRWMAREVTQFNPDASEKLMEALRSGSARSLAALCAEAPFATIPNLSLAVDVCPSMKEGRSQDCPTFVSARTITAAPKRAVLDSFEQAKGKFLFREMQLNRDELAALAPRFKMFETIAGRTAVESLLPEPAAGIAEGRNITYADISPLPEDHCGKIMTRKTVLIASIFSFAMLIGLFASIGLMLCGTLIGFPDNAPAGGVSPATRNLSIVLISVGGLWLLLVIVSILTDPSFVGNRYLRKVVRRELERRTSLLVDLNDPDALFVEYVPKMNWGKLMLDNAADVGLLVVDQQKREIRFEGDKERWRIPASSITYCQLEVFTQQQGHAKTKMYYAVLRANHRGGFWEVPIRPRGKLGLFSGKRKKAVEQLVDAIQRIQGAKQEIPATVT